MKDKRHDVKEGIHRRALLLGGVGLCGIGVLSARLYQLQFLQGARYRDLAEGNRISVQIVAPERGLILDRHGAPLAENKPQYRLYLDRDRHPNPKAVLERLGGWVELSDPQQQRLQEILRQGGRKPLLIKDSLNWEELVRIQHHAAELPGIYIGTGQQRHYPLALAAAHVVGYIGKVSAQELEESNHYYRWPEATIGKQGLEKVAELTLRGKPGMRQLEVDAHGLTVQQLAETPPVTGQSFRTFLDAGLQDHLYRKLQEAHSGAAILMEVDTGEIRALASAPSFDSLQMSAGIDRDNWQKLRQDKLAPLMNKAITGQYAPGSTFKNIVALAALNRGVTPWRTVYCPGYFHLGKQRFRCWKQGGHGDMDLHHALAESCDTYFYEMAREMGIEPIAEMARLFGLGEATGIGLPAEESGIVPTPEWKQQHRAQRWQGGDTINAAIGQGYVLATPLQLAVMTCRMVNGGRVVYPRLYPQDNTTSTPESTPTGEALPLNRTHLNTLKRAMDAVVNKPYGTAFATRQREAPFFGGKTGTAQVRRITIQNQPQDKLARELRHHALFVGYAPIEKPRLAAAVVLEHGGYSSRAAALAGDILHYALEQSS